MKEKSPIKNRIIQFVDSEGISKYEFYKKTGITRGVLDKDNGITESNIAKFIAYFKKINPVWLLTGEGEMIISNKNSTEKPPPVTKQTVDNTFSKSVMIPLIPQSSINKYFEGEISQKELLCDYYVIPDFIDADFLLSVRDMSMQPKFNSGDIIACKKIPSKGFIQWGKIYLIDTVQGLLIKRIEEVKNKTHLLLASNDISFKPFQVLRSEIKILALVRGSIHVE